MTLLRRLADALPKWRGEQSEAPLIPASALPRPLPVPANGPIACIVPLPAPDAPKTPPRPITGEHGSYPLAPHLRRLCAIFEDGTFLVERSRIADAEIQSAAERARVIHKIPVKPPTPVDLEEILAAYQTAARQITGDHTATRARLHGLIERAAKHRVSDIQISHSGETATVRYQIDKYLSDPIAKFHADEAAALFTSAYNLADISPGPERTDISQQAAITDPKHLPAGVFALRLHFLPKPNGRHLNIRLIYHAHAFAERGLVDYGLLPEHLEALHYVQSFSAGLITMGGPTESGKTTLANIWLADLCESKENRLMIYSVQDPPEGLDPRFTIVTVTQESYDAALRDSLRVAPHVVHIGEARSDAAARAAYDAVLTGKLTVVSTHADEGLDVPDRWCRLGIPPVEAYDARRHAAWVNQRLIPRLCGKCRRPFAEAADANPRLRAAFAAFRAALGDDQAARLYTRGPGCSECRPQGSIGGMRGVRGRIFAGEVILPTPELCARLRTDRQDARRYWLAEMRGTSLRAHAWMHLRAGLIAADDYLGFVGTPSALAADLELLKDRL